jgi:choloylglycine hydrolase
MDWPDSTYPVITVFPSGLKRNGGMVGPFDVVGENPLIWTSKYGSLVTTIYGVGTAEGFNEKGFAARLLYLAHTDFGLRDLSKPGIHAGLWAQYLLDCASTVEEALLLMDEIQLIMMESHGHKATVHLSMDDQSGDSAIIEYQNGERKIFHGPQFQVQTNEPPYQEQLDMLAEMDFSNPSDNTPLDGNVNPVARFQRAAYFLNLLPEPANSKEAIAGLMSIVRNVSIPFGSPYESFGTYDTEYRTVMDLSNLRYYFELSRSPNVIWVDLNDFAIENGAGVKELNPDDITLTGNVGEKFSQAETIPF